MLVAANNNTLVATQEIDSLNYYPGGCVFMYVLDPKTGHQRWMTAFSDSVDSMKVVDNHVYLRTTLPSTLAAWNALTGQPAA